MKIIVFCCTLLMGQTIIAQPGNSEELSSEGLKIFDSEKGNIQYEVTDGGEGSVSFSFDRYGLRSSSIHTMSYTMYGIEAKMNEQEIRDGVFRYIYDLEKGSGRQKKITTEIDLLRYKSSQEARESIFSVNGGSMVGKEQILDKETEHWTFTTGPLKEAWYWKGLILKARMKRPRVTYTYTATSIDLENGKVEYPDIQIADN